MKLYLCEKPSQGRDVAKFLGMTPANKKQGYYESGNIVVTWALGHLFKLQPPEYYTPSLKSKWSFSALPVIPDEYKYSLDSKSKPQFNVIKRLLKRADSVYIATDPDPEGEVIARNILKFAGYKNDIFRILYGSNDKKTLTKAFSNPRPIWETEWMYNVAVSRAYSDWIVGMNLTMAMTLVTQKLESSGGHKHKKAFPIGRVKTPAAMLVYLREKAIKEFKSRTYYEVEIDLSTQTGEVFSVLWDVPDKALEDGKLFNRAYADQAVEYLKKHPEAVVDSVVNTEKSKEPPLPYELTSLQSDCAKYDIKPKETLEIAQSLYVEPFSATSYPRSDTPYLTNGLADDINETVEHLTKIDKFSDWVKVMDLKKRTKAWNDKKVKVHYGIIPTVNVVNFERLVDKQRAVYMLIAKRYLLQFMPDYVYYNTVLTIKIGNLSTTTTCNVVKNLGWRSFEVDKKSTEVVLPVLDKGQCVTVKSVRILEKTTRSPPRYKQATLAAAMINIADEIDDPLLKKSLSSKDGIGTVTTRPAIISDLVLSGVLAEDNNELSPSRRFDKYVCLIPDQIKKPVNAALWERGFEAIQEENINIEQFVSFQEKFVKSAVKELEKVFSEIK